MCECIKTPRLIAGWGCCADRVYNGLQRDTCRGCGRQRCKPLLPDTYTGEQFETYEEAYKDDPEHLAVIQAQLNR
jgi:hypothetical protein